MTDLVLVLSTVPDDASAETIARTLVEEKLAACVNLFSPMRSVYRWKGAVEWATERQLVIKTSPSLVAAVRERIKTLHSYELPEFIVIAAEASGEYLKWMAENL
jgi:periplasmic divalent cation tolerance protein